MSGRVVNQDEGIIRARRKAVEQIPLFRMVSQRYPDVIGSLVQHPRLNGGVSSRFIYMISNLVKGFPGTDISSDPVMYTETFTGERMQLANDSMDSELTGTFSLEFEELADMRIAYLLRVWIMYQNLVMRGKIFTKLEYVALRRIDYAASLYCFSIGPDGETIQYYSKYTGVFPIGLSLSAFQEQFGENSPVTISSTWAYNKFEAMDPVIFRDFNAVASENPALMMNPTGEGIGAASDWVELSQSIDGDAGGIQYAGTARNTADSIRRGRRRTVNPSPGQEAINSGTYMAVPVQDDVFTNYSERSIFKRVRIVQKPGVANESGQDRTRYCLHMSQ
jgi:hypothetical protein